MNFNKLIGIFFLSSQTLSLQSYAQTISRPQENEMPQKSWWERSTYESDTSARAVILLDFGQCTADPLSGVKLKRFRRIKIFKKSAIKNWGTFSISEKNARLTEFTCSVYNMVDGEIKISKLDKNQLISDKGDENESIKHVAIPNVLEGSIIDINFTIKIPNYTITPWMFQYTIPVEWSEFEIFFPGSMYGVVATINGMMPLDDISIKEKGRRRKYILTRIPAFAPEPFMPNQVYYRSSIEFEEANTGKFEEIYLSEDLRQDRIFRDSFTRDSKVTTNVSVKADLELFYGKIKVTNSGHVAETDWTKIDEANETVFLSGKFDFEAMDIHSTFIDPKSTPTIINFGCEFTLPNRIQQANELLLIDTSFDLPNDFPRLNATERRYPVYFKSRTEWVTTISIELPNNYKVESLPKSSAIELSGKKGSFAFNVSQLENKVYIVSRLKINKVVFNVDEYTGLRDFLTRIIAKRAEPIVLKKL